MFRYLIITELLFLSKESDSTPIPPVNNVVEDIPLSDSMKCEPTYMETEYCPCAFKGLCLEDREICSCCFEDFYENPKDNCIMKDFCKPNPCNNGGTCQPMLGHYFCSCPAAYHGTNCEKEAGSKVIKRIVKPLIGLPPVLILRTVQFIFLILEDFGNEFTFNLNIGLLTFTGDDTNFEDNVSLKETFKADYDLWMNFPEVATKLFFCPYGLDGSREQGKQEIFTVEFNNSGYVQFHQIIKTFLAHKEGIKPCNEHSFLELKGCSHQNTDVVQIQRAKGFEIQGTSSMACTTKFVQSYWYHCELNKNVPFPLRPNEMYNFPTKKVSNCWRNRSTETFHNFKPFSLHYGLQAMISYAYHKTNNTGKAWSLKDTCYFSVVADPLIAKLEGGSFRVVDNSVQLQVNATESFDPNEPKGVEDHLVYDWSCTPEDATLCLGVPKIKADKLVLEPIPGKYTFTVTVSVNKAKAPNIGTFPEEILPASAVATQTVTILKELVTELEIRCKRNCADEVITGEILYLTATCKKLCNGSDEKGFYKWVVPEMQLKEADTQLGLDIDLLIINENVLTPGKNYTFTVSGGNKGKAEFLVTARRTLESVLGDGNCKFLPQSGISGFDLFNLTCEYPNTIYGFPLRFELFQVPNISNPDSEILIAFSDENKILGLLLAAGEKSQGYQTHIYLRIEDHFAESMKIKVATVTVKPITETPGSKNITDTIQKLISGTSGTPSMESYVSLGDISGAVGLISLLTVALATSDLKPEEVWKFKKQFISSLDQIPLNNDAPIRQVVSVLHLVLGAGEREDEIPPECVREISNIILKLTTEMTLQINESYIEYEVSTQELKTIYHMMLEMLSCLLYSMNETIAKITIPPAFEVTTLPGEEIPDYAEYYELNPNYFKCVENFKKASRNIILCIQNIGKALLHRLAEEQLPISITTKYLTMWVKLDKVTNFEQTLIGNSTTGEGINFPHQLVENLKNQREYIGLQVAFTGKNPFIWDKESKDINTGLVIVDIYNQELNESVSIPSDADIFLKEFQNLSSTIIEGNVTVPLKSKDDIDILEECMTVHKIEAKEGQTPFLKFEPLEDQSFKIQIVVTVGVRPTAEMFTKYSESVPHSVQPGSLDDQLTVFVDGVNLLKRSWFFLAVLPHPDTLENVTQKLGTDSNFTIKYAFNVRIIKCHFWNLTTMRWSSSECKPGLETGPEQLHCRCSHLSTFSGSLLAPDIKGDFFTAIPMLILGSDNIVIPIFVAIILSLYIIILCWAQWKDKYDVYERVVTVLQDNYSGRNYTYLIGVYTGFRRNAGTSANVAIQIIGEKFKSKVHILQDNTRTVHSRNSDSWFVIFSTNDLGRPKTLRLWHDNSGRFPPWYCERVVVEDVQKKRCSIFLVRRWLSLIHGGGNIYYTLQPATQSDLQQWLLLFKDNVNLGFQEQHIWSNIFMRHPWSTYTRIERLTVALCIIITTMLLSLVLYEVPKGIPADQIDEADFHFPSMEFGIVLEASFLLAPFHFILVILFRKAAPRKIQHNPQAEAILVEIPRKRHKPTWWQRFLMFFMLEPLVHPARARTELMAMESNSSDELSKEESPTELIQEFRGSKYWLPFWVTFIGWALCGVIIIASASILILLGLAYAVVKSEMWIVAVLMYIFLSIIILQPLKILIFSLGLSFLCKKESSNMQEVDVFFVKKDKVQEEMEKIQVKIKKLRMQQMYRPLKIQDIMKLKRHEKARSRLADLFIDLCMFLVYIITLYWLVLGTRDNLAYFSTNSVREAIIHKYEFSHLTSGIAFFNYMNATFLPAIHTEHWYNEAKMKSLGRTSLYDTKLLGVIRLRQIRIKNETCEVLKPMQSLWNTCNAEFNLAYEDRENYDVGWQQFDKLTYRATRASNPWIYNTGWSSGTVPVAGKFAIYPGGGYITTLGRTLNNSQLIFDFLVQQKWFNYLTRAVFIEFTLYNANRNIFNVVILLLEFAPTGAIHTQEDIKTVKLLLSLQEFGPMILTAFALWVMVLVSFMVRQMAKFGYISIHNYFQSWWNIIDIIILTLASTTIILYILRSKYTSNLLKDLEEADGDEYVNFMWAGFWQVLLRYFLAVLLGLSTARLWKLLRFIQQFCNFEHTLVRASKPLFFLVFMMFIIITACALFSYLFVSSATYLFSSILSSYTQVLIFGTGINEIKFDDFFKQDSFIGHAFLVVFWLLYVVYLINIFITILNISYEQSSAEIGLFREDYTMLDYIREEMHYICSCKKCKRSVTPRKELSVQEKYPHYFKQDISKTNSPSEDENLQKNDKRADVVFDGRLRAGSDVPSQPVFSPAIAVPKPNEIRKQNVELLPNNRLQSMQHLARYTIQEKSSQEDTHEQAIMSFIKSHIEHFKPKGTKEQGIFYRGLDGNEQKLVPNDKLLQMETVVNKLGAEIYAAKNVDYDDTSDDESIDDDNLITPTESYGYADVLALQFNRLDKMISNWDSKVAVEVEDSEIGDKQRTEEEHESKTSTQEHEIASKVSDSEIIQHPEIHKTTEPVGKISRQKPETIHPKDLITDQEDSDKEKIMSATRLPVQEHDSVQDIDTGTVLADSKDKTKRKDEQTKGIGTAAILGTTKPVRKDKTSSKPVKTDNRIKSHYVEKKLKDIMSHSEKTEGLNSQSKISNNGKEKEQYTETGPLEDAMIATTAGNLLYQNKRKESVDDKRNIKDKAKKRRLSKKKDTNQIKTTKHDNGMEEKVIEEEPITSKRVDALYAGKTDYGTPKKTKIEMQDNQERSPNEIHEMVPDKFSTNIGSSRTTAVGGQPSLTSPVAALGTTPLKVIGSSPSTSTEAETSIKPMGNTYTVDYCGLFPLKKLVKEEKPTKENQQQPSSTSQTGAKRKTQQKIESFPIASDTHNPFAENLTPEYLARLQNVQHQLDSQRLPQVPESSARLVANRLQTYEINSNRAISYQPVSENQRNFTHIIQNSLPRHQERYVSQGFPSNASLLGNFTLHGHFSRTDGLRTNEENYHARPDITFPQNNTLSRTDEFRESEQSYPGHYLTRPSFFTRAERPLECDISYPREQNMYAEPIREQLLEAQIPEYSTTPELTNTIPLDMVTRQDLRMPIENSAMQQNRNFSEVREAVESMYTPNMRLRQSTDTEGDLNRMVSYSNIRESANDADVRTRNSLIRTRAGLDELRIDLNNRNINVHNQAGQEQRTNVGRNITGQNQISQQNQNNDRAQSRDRMFYTERQQQNESNRNRRGYRQGCSNTRTKRSTRNSEESATVYPLQTPCLVFPLPSPYVGLTYLSPVLPYSSNYMQPFASPGGQYWNQNDSRDLQFGFRRRQGYANTQYMPYERESHRHVRSQRYNRQTNIETQESVHQGWQIPSQSEYTPNYNHARRGYGVDFTSENLSYSYSPMQRAHRQPGSVLPGAENSSTFLRWRPSASQHESGRGRRKMRSRRR